MADNFIHSAERMRDSSNILHLNKDFHNSCYMAGYVVECYLKIFMNFSLPIPSSNPRSYGHNINQLSADLYYAATSAASASAYRSYIIDVHTECNNIINTWNPIKRYEDNPNAWDETMSINFHQEKEKCFDILTKMTIDNVI
ncbi:hypothetical protein [Chryseobacterium sp. HR92]|uniref:hypothetical protein n=1 Tax=Chryseobacterium sp. HR92 TaxID=3094839 RepID=UPI00388E22E2|nr:hypothetical protein SFA27_07720 [Chryseobacterium sp. HR92]